MTGFLLWLLASSAPPAWAPPPAAPPDRAEAEAADWRWVLLTDQEDGRRAWFIDRASLERAGDTVRFVELVVFRPDARRDTMEPTTDRMDGDCRTRIVTVYQRHRVTGAEAPGVRIDAPPDTAAGQVLDAACKGKFAARVRDPAMNAHLLFEMSSRKRGKRR